MLEMNPEGYQKDILLKILRTSSRTDSGFVTTSKISIGLKPKYSRGSSSPRINAGAILKRINLRVGGL
jgi:hypothetical protein